MKLNKAIEIGKTCGLETVEECMRNVEIHALSFFRYEDINKELNEMHNEWKAGMKQPKESCRYCAHADGGTCEYAGEISTEFVCDLFKKEGI